MKQLWLTAKLDIVESLRARWFQIYTLVFGGIVALLFLFGVFLAWWAARAFRSACCLRKE